MRTVEGARTIRSELRRSGSLEQEGNHMTTEAVGGTVGGVAADFYPESDAPFKIEAHGIDIIPDADRHGRPIELFWMWAGALIGIVDLVIGAVVLSLGLSLWEAVAAIVIGNLVSYIFMGLAAMNGPAGGTPTIVISRAAFGVRGNVLTNLFSFLTIVGWEGVNSVVGVLALIGLFTALGLDGQNNLVKLLAIAVFMVVMCVWAVFGHATLVIINRILLIAVGIAMLGVLFFGFQHVIWNYAGGQLAGSNRLTTFVLGAMIAAAANGFAFMNMPADYSRYLPKSASRRQIAFWSALGAFLPATILNAAGAFIGTGIDTFDPIGSLQKVVPGWFLVIFLIIATISMVAANTVNTYSSGLNLLALGLKMQRYKTVVIDATLATAFVLYALFVFNFVGTLINFLVLMIWWIAPWSGIYLVDMALKKFNYRSEDLLRSDGGAYWYRKGVNWNAIAALVIGAVAAAAFTNATFFVSPIVSGPLGGMDLSIPVGLIVGGGLYYILEARRSTTPAISVG
jgi:nucleobase:cation symporter-1, NCS1 family